MPPFLNSIFLWGLAAAALPILIHLFSRRRVKEVRFPSLEFLQEVARKKARRIQLRQLLLLVLRVLIIAFFALAMSRPAMRAGGALGRGSSTVALLIDNSYSMSARDPSSTGIPTDETAAPATGAIIPEQGAVYQAAKKRALEIIGMMSEGDRGVIALGAAPIRMPFQTAITDLNLLRQEVERSEIAATPADLPQAVAKLAGVLAGSRTLNRELYIISDFQRIDVEAWQALLGGGADSTRAGGPGSGLPEDVRVYLLPVRSLPVDNMSISRVRLDAVGAGADAPARLVVTVQNFGDHEAGDVVLRAVSADPGAGGEALGEAYATVPPMGQADATVLLRRMPSGGALRLAMTPDPLTLDNTAYLVTEQPGIRRILLISGSADPSSDPGVRYLKLALDPVGNREFFDVAAVSASDPNLASALGVDVVVLVDVGRLPDAAVDRIARFRAEGGGVLIVMGDRVDPRWYNTAVFPKLAHAELLGVQGDPTRPDLFRSLRITAVEHPIFEGFPTAPGANLTAARFLRVLDVRPGGGTRVLAEFSGGIPAVIEDQGSIVFASSVDGSWSDLPTSGAFVPLVHRMVQHLTSRTGSADRLLVGSVIERPFDEDAVGTQEVFCVDPSGARTMLAREEREGKIWFSCEPARAPGFYEFVRGDGVRLGIYAVNLDTRESDLRVAPDGWLPRLFNPPAKVLKPDGDLTRQLAQGRYGRELWPLLLGLVLGLLVVEGLVGRGSGEIS